MIFGPTAFGDQVCEGKIISIVSMEPDPLYKAIVGVMEEGGLELIVKETTGGVWIESEQGKIPSLLHRWMFFSEDAAYKTAVEINERKIATAQHSIKLLEKIRFKTDFKGLNIIIESKWEGNTGYIVSKDGKFGIIDDLGEQLVPIGMDEIQDRIDNFGVYPLRKANKWGIYTNGLYVEPIYEELSFCEDGSIKALLDNRWGRLNSNGQYISERPDPDTLIETQPSSMQSNNMEEFWQLIETTDNGCVERYAPIGNNFTLKHFQALINKYGVDFNFQVFLSFDDKDYYNITVGKWTNNSEITLLTNGM